MRNSEPVYRHDSIARALTSSGANRFRFAVTCKAFKFQNYFKQLFLGSGLDVGPLNRKRIRATKPVWGGKRQRQINTTTCTNECWKRVFLRTPTANNVNLLDVMFLGRFAITICCAIHKLSSAANARTKRNQTATNFRYLKSSWRASSSGWTIYGWNENKPLLDSFCSCLPFRLEFHHHVFVSFGFFYCAGSHRKGIVISNKKLELFTSSLAWLHRRRLDVFMRRELLVEWLRPLWLHVTQTFDIPKCQLINITFRSFNGHF